MKQILSAWTATMIFGLAIAAAPASAVAQNLPPPGAYQPIPDYSGTNAGLLFREAINDRLSGAQPISPSFVSLSFANLPAEQDGTMFYCVDCQKASPCTGGGSGAWALGQNGMWSCAASASSLSMGGDVTGISSASRVNTVEGGKVPVVTGGANTAAGASGADALTGFNVNGQQNVLDFGVLSTSTMTETATTTASSTSVSLGAIADFAVGQGVLLPHAGPTASVTAPTGFTGSNISYTLNGQPSALLNAAYPCSVDSSNASCTTSYTVKVIAVDAQGGWSPASSAVTVTNGPATLSVDNAVIWKWTGVTNATSYIVLGCTGASCTPTSIWAVVSGGSNSDPFFWDFGNHFGADITYGSTISTTVQGTGANQDLSTTIIGVSGTTLTLATAPSVSGNTFTIRHDNAPAINAAIATRASSGGDILLPLASADYPVSQINFAQTENVALSGTAAGKWGAAATKFNFIGSAGRPMVYMDWAAGTQTHDWMYDTSSTPGEIVYIDADSTFSGPQRSKGNEIYHISAGPANPTFGAAVTIGINSGGGENEFVYIHDNYFGGIGYQGVVVAAGYQTDNTEIDRNITPVVNFGYSLFNAGTVNQKNNDCGSSYICHYVAGYFKNWNIDGDYTDGGPTYWLYDNNGGGAVPEIRISNSFIASTPGPNGYGVLEDSSAIFESNSFSCNGSNNCLIGVNGASAGYRRATFIGNTYNSQYPSGLPSTLEPPYGLPITDSTGVNSIPHFISLGESMLVGGSYIALGDVFNGELSLTVNGTPLDLVPSATTLTGTAGTALCSMSMQGTLKTATCYLNAYQETGSAQTFTFPTAFSAAPNLLASCGTYNPTATASVLTLPANASMTAETCNVTAIGQ